MLDAMVTFSLFCEELSAAADVLTRRSGAPAEIFKKMHKKKIYIYPSLFTLCTCSAYTQL